jgi:hypothetical protein
MGMIQRFLSHVMPGVVRPLRVLWNELIGFIFLVLAAGAVVESVKSIRQFQGDAGGVVRVGMTIVFSSVMVYFAATSFMRARKISRSS